MAELVLEMYGRYSLSLSGRIGEKRGGWEREGTVGEGWGGGGGELRMNSQLPVTGLL